MNIVLGILALIIGATLATTGLQIYLVLLPIAGFVFGFFTGAAAIASLFGDGFLASTLGFLAGIVVGLGFAVLSYFYWYIGALITVAAAGFIFGASLFGAIGISSEFLLFLLAIMVAAAFFVAAFIVNLPVYVVIIGTALSGSALAIGGLLVLLGYIQPGAVASATTWNAIQGNLFLWLVWGVGATVGVIAQIARIEKVTLPEERWTSAAKR